MHPFQFERAQSVKSATQSAARDTNTHFVAGGTSQIDLMKEDVHRPARLVDVGRLPLVGISEIANGGLRIGANVKNSEAAYHPLVQARYPALAEAILAGASPQIRNMASMGGNLLQRTRCPYFRDTTQACNKRQPGSGCAAIEGFNRIHAIFGASAACIATHPSDMCIALTAHEAVVVVQGPNGTRQVPFSEFHRLPGDTPQWDTTLRQGEIIVALELPAFGGNSHYVKVRDRASYAFALVSAAVALKMDGANIGEAKIALGGVAHKPWRATDAETLLKGQKPSEILFRQVAERAFESAKTFEMNAYKVPMGRNVLVRCLMETSGLMPLPGPKGTALAASAGGIAGETATE